MIKSLHSVWGALALCLAIHALALPAAALAQAAAKPAATSSARLDGVVNVNQASSSELELLPGVGPARAKAIVDYRNTNGAFERIDDLLRVSGIGKRALERLRPYVVLEGKTTATGPAK